MTRRTPSADAARALALVALSLAALVLGGCARREPEKKHDAAEPPSRAIIVISADTRGYLAPCGCSENMRGGIARAAHQLGQLRAGPLPVLYVDGGNTLFGELAIPPERRGQDEARAKALAKALEQMQVTARATGRLDLAQGPAFLESLALPSLQHPVEVFDVGGIRVALVQVSGQRDVAAAAQQLAGRREHLTVALVDASLLTAQQWVRGAPFDLAIATRSEGEFGAEENRVLPGEVPVVQLQSKGRSLLRIDVSLTGEGSMRWVEGAQEQERTLAAIDERVALLEADVNRPDIAPELKRLKSAKLAELSKRRAAIASAVPAAPTHDAFQLRFIPLEASLPGAPEVAAIVAGHDRAVGSLNLQWAREHGKDCAPPAPGEPAFVGNAACRGCHEEAFGVYEQSKHAHAWETLEAQGKQFHLDCIGCHVTGMNRAGGVCRVDRVEGREDVGCESCHGAGSLHVEAPSSANIVPAPKAAQCLGCHNPENSPHFDFERYLPRILGEGHGG